MTDMQLHLDCWERLVVEMPFDPTRPHRPKGPVLESLAGDHAVFAGRSPPTRLLVRVDQSLAGSSQAAAQLAITSYCQYKATEARAAIRATIRVGWFSLGIALLLLTLSLGTAAALDHFSLLPARVNRWLVEGWVILGWVVLWRPLDNLLFEWWHPWRTARAYTALGKAEIVVTTAGIGGE